MQNTNETRFTNKTRFTNISGTAKRYGFGQQYLRREVAAGRVPCIRVGRKTLIDTLEFSKILSQRTTETAAKQ